MPNHRDGVALHQSRYWNQHWPNRQDPIDQSFDDYQLFIGGHRSDSYVGSEKMDLVFGRHSGDDLRGAGMEDDLFGGKGADQLHGGDGADHLEGGRNDDAVYGGAEADALRGGDGRDYLDEGVGHGDLEGGRGDDTLVGGLGADAFMVSPDSGDDVVEDFTAGPGIFDHLALRDIQPEELRFQNSELGVLVSWSTEQGDGSVLLKGVLKGDLAQDDFMFVDDRFLIEPTSIDADHVEAISFAKDEGGDLSPQQAEAGTRPDASFRFDEFNVKFGTDNPDIFSASGRRDMYFGLDGDDQLYGGKADDHLAGDAGNDLLDGEDGMDDLRGGSGDDQLYGGNSADNLMGSVGRDTLLAGAGHDMLEGGEGDDVLHGGDGADAFIVAHGSGRDDVVGGFDAGPGAFDHIAFKDILPDEVSVVESGGGTLVSWSDGSIFLAGVQKSQLAQDDFMFNAVEGGGFVDDPTITFEGSRPIFQPDPDADWLMS